jgi:hypothetical protein
VDHFVPKEWASGYWYNVVGSGDLKHLGAGMKVKPVPHQWGAVVYICMYISDMKKAQKQVPDGYLSVGRMWGASRGLASAEDAIPLSDEEGEALAAEGRRLMAIRMGHRGNPRGDSRCGIRVFGGASALREALAGLRMSPNGVTAAPDRDLTQARGIVASGSRAEPEATGEARVTVPPGARKRENVATPSVVAGMREWDLKRKRGLAKPTGVEGGAAQPQDP